MYKGLLIHGHDVKAQPMDTKKEHETEREKEQTETHSKDYEAIRKLVKDTDKTKRQMI